MAPRQKYFESSLERPPKINTPLKMVIAAKHDFTVDAGGFEAQTCRGSARHGFELVARGDGVLDRRI